jgi:glutamyl-Q tRNA(Asp) synthetase
MSSVFRTRFAPSPTGYLHLGHAYAARVAFDTAMRAGGECWLRIEDIDQTRCRPDYEASIYEDLAWLGFNWPEPVRRQSDHFTDYENALGKLIELGLVYRCFLTRKALNAELDKRSTGLSPAGERPYSGPAHPLSGDEETERITKGEAFAWRLSLSACRDHLGDDWHRLGFEENGGAPELDQGFVKAHPEWLGDVVLARKDTPTSYHLACCHDDALQGMTHIVRGADLYHATHIHVLLQALMDWTHPVYHHHGLVLDEAGRKFSKSDQSKTIRDMRQQGLRAEDVFREIQF